jgi:hypothetical protein
MASVNDLAQEWREVAGNLGPRQEKTYMAGFDNGQYIARKMCASEVEHHAHTAWHPVSERPTEDDAEERTGQVLILDHAGCVGKEYWDEVNSDPEIKQWARIRDVVLLPPGE